jgi:hypothetical protein
MSVKVVSPTESGQPQLPMPLRPPVTPAAAGTHHGRLRRSRPTPDGEGRPRPPAAVDPGQPELPMSLRPPTADAGRAEVPASLRPHTADVELEQVSSVPADPEQPELPASLRPPIADSPQAQLPESLRPPIAPAAGVQNGPPADAERSQSELPMALRPPAAPVAAGLLAQARRGLAEAERETAPAERFIGAYLAALRGAAAVLAARGRPHRGRARPASTWVLLDSVAPELREWSAFFAGNSAARAAAQAGITGKVTAESAAELVRAAAPFLELVRRLVHGLPITGEAHVA